MQPTSSPSPASALPTFADLVQLLQTRAVDQASKRAFGYLDKSLELSETCTYAELDVSARVIATALQGRGLQGQRALLMYPSGISFIQAFFGCLYAGVVPVPLYPPQTAGQILRLANILMDARPAVALGNTLVQTKVQANFGDAWAQTGLELIDTDQLAEDPAHWQKPEIDPDGLAFLQYTSGSTGNPKGVMVSHKNLLHNARLMAEAMGTDYEELIGLGWLPLFHDMGLIGHVIKPIFVGGSSYIMSPMTFLSNPVRWLQAISKVRATHSGAPNFAYARSVEKMDDASLAELDLSSWRRAYCGAEPIQSETMRRFADRMTQAGLPADALTPCYGMAETTLMVSCKPWESTFVSLPADRQRLAQGHFHPAESADPNPVHLVSCGRPYGGLKIRVVQADHGQALPAGQVGEIWVQGTSVAAGYWNQPEQTALTFQASLEGEAGNWLRTGDLGFMYEEEVFVTGRVKDMIIIRGRNYYPQDFEQTSMEAHPGLQRGGTAAFAVPHEGGEALVIVQELSRHALREHTAEEMLAAIRLAISAIHSIQPHIIALVPRRTVPKTSSGKVQRQACRQTYLKGKLDISASWEGSTQAEVPAEDAPAEKLAQSAADVLQWILNWVADKAGETPERISAADSLQAYGLDSMQLGELEGSLGAYLGHTWPVNDFLLREPSLEELAEESWRRKELG